MKAVQWARALDIYSRHAAAALLALAAFSFPLAARAATAADVPGKKFERPAPEDGSVHLVQKVEMAIHKTAVTLTRSIEVQSDEGDDVDVTCNFLLRATKPEEGFKFADGEGSIDGDDLPQDAIRKICEEMKAAPDAPMPGMPDQKEKGSGEERDSNEDMEESQIRGYKASLTAYRIREIARAGRARGPAARLALLPPAPERRCERPSGSGLTEAYLGSGNPMLTVDAPPDAKKVVAHFPFGPIRSLAFDALRRHWSLRVPVPEGVRQGSYTTWVEVVHPNGRTEWRRVHHAIHENAPEFVARVPSRARPGGQVRIEVDPLEPAQGVSVAVAGLGDQMALVLDEVTGRYQGDLGLPAIFPDGKITVQIRVRTLTGKVLERGVELGAATESDLAGCRMPNRANL